MTGPDGMFSRPPTRCVSRHVRRSQPRQKSIQNSDQATTQRRGISRIGEPTMARTAVPRYQPTLNASERSQRLIMKGILWEDAVFLVTPVLVA